MEDQSENGKQNDNNLNKSNKKKNTNIIKKTESLIVR